jgi:hypothetical protein
VSEPDGGVDAFVLDDLASGCELADRDVDGAPNLIVDFPADRLALVEDSLPGRESEHGHHACLGQALRQIGVAIVIRDLGDAGGKPIR